MKKNNIEKITTFIKHVSIQSLSDWLSWFSVQNKKFLQKNTIYNEEEEIIINNFPSLLNNLKEDCVKRKYCFDVHKCIVNNSYFSNDKTVFIKTVSF